MYITMNLAELEFQQRSYGSIYIEVHGFLLIPGLMYGILLMALMFLPPTRNWARGERARKRGLPAEAVAAQLESDAGQQVCALAVISMILSMIPFMLLTQLTSLILGIIALRKIRNSGGTLSGRGYAWTGVIISSLILTCIGSLVGVAIVASNMSK
jgi:hypothetical protein